MKKMFEKLFGSYSSRELKRIEPIIEEIESLETEMAGLTDEDLKNKTVEFKKRLDEGSTLDDILPEAYAVVREASSRVLGMKHYRVQLIGGIILHQGRIAEMKTGEGKTLVATLPVYLNALAGKGVHVITVNDYLAQRDRDWMGKLYNFMGLSVGCIVNGLDNDQRRKQYNSDITYGTNNEFGFDYLRDNMVVRRENMVQGELNYCIIDEVDSILVDEARTPLIISGVGDKSTDLYLRANSFVQTLKGRKKDPDENISKMDLMMGNMKEETVDFVVDEKGKSVLLTEKGITKAEQYFNIENLADEENMELTHHINQALKAHNIMVADIDYIVRDGEVMIVDEFTGRLMQGRRFSKGLHQAIEAKERLDVKRESKTLATITYQNYFRMYTKLSGMTGTAKTEEQEFREIYNVDVIEIPTNRPVVRADDADVIYKTEAAKFNAVIEEIIERNKKGQPVLVGTISIEKSELLSRMLKKRNITHNVLNAKNHEKEAEIVAQAGRFGSVTIATNMAGRGTDIVLGGNPEFTARNKIKAKFPEEIAMRADGYDETDDEEVLKARELYRELKKKDEAEMLEENKKVLEAGGLCIIGTERHESRRIDNQLRGRAGRQGDPGSSKFYISLDDDLMRLFAGDKVKVLVDTLKLPDDEPLQHSMLSKSIETAQGRVEGRNFNIRKHVLQYDNVMNKQREVIYSERRKVLMGEDLKDHIMTMVKEQISLGMGEFTAEKYPENWDINGYEGYLSEMFGANIKLKIDDVESLTTDKMNELSMTLAQKLYAAKEREFGEERFREVERVVLLKTVDTKWMDHIDAMDQLRQGVALRAMGNEDPVRAYQNEGFDMFQELIGMIQEDTVKYLYRVRSQEKMERQKVAKETGTNLNGNGAKPKTVVKGRKIGRNEPCPCGSGKKYKRCCGKDA
ncbi:protein translocase subunit secA [Dethiosulfatibacter aminovorans DSM 17477]|uniref:Protein translocase subunit SecA n=1 Tax=Dethiosulfatibacter aminovorans DSM 17477 TaxID=1121476 RepID=A0A1M6FT72_9FIRM|nr:preprotein translocase subunit SecA [Dethiosulfatibacter aminovorans]SHJ00908.1 protein translocase subunit secA [Dethiosulfatibacter aminovorans DSM 17477]